jgi:hypothetical protein
MSSRASSIPARRSGSAIVPCSRYGLFVRARAAIAMRVEDVYTERRQLWVRLWEKGGKTHVMPCHQRQCLTLKADILYRL